MSNSEPYIGKLNTKTGVIHNDCFVYCPPDFLTLNSKKDLEPLLDEYKNTGAISIQTIMDFQSKLNKR